MSLSGLQTNISTRPQDPTNANRDASSRSKKFGTLTRKYDKEKERRERSDGVEQYVELEESTRFAYLAEDPFVDHESMNAQPSPLQDGQEVKVIILGAGFAGLLFAARLIEAGTSPDDIRLVDIAVRITFIVFCITPSGIPKLLSYFSEDSFFGGFPYILIHSRYEISGLKLDAGWVWGHLVLESLSRDHV